MTPRRSSPSLALLRAALALTAGLVVLQAALGFLGALALAPGLTAAVLVVAAVCWCWRGARPAAPVEAPAAAEPRAAEMSVPATWARVLEPAAVAALVAALVERAWTGLHRTTFLYDVVSYHLHLPAAWRAAGRLTLVPTPFGDPAPAYTPANAELLFGLALAAAGNASLAHAGQVPFAALAGLAIHATARQVGASRAVALAAALTFLLLPEVWQQAPTAMADLAMASFFLAALPFLLRLESAPRGWPDWLSLGAALGLLLGTKYVSVVLSLPLLLWTAVVWGRAHRATEGPAGVSTVSTLAVVPALAAAVFACGGFWYLRNAALTGNPLFPATLALGGRVFGAGLLDGAALRASEYHLPVHELGALAELLGDCGWAFWAAVALATWFGRRTRWPILLVVVTLLLWFVVPYQQSRFFFAAFGVGAILLAAAAVRAPRASGGALAAAAVGSVLQFPTAGRLAVIACAAVGAGAAAVLSRRGHGTIDVIDQGGRRWRPMLTGSRRGRIAGAAATAALVAGTIVWARTRAHLPAYGVGDEHDAAWRWMDDHARGVRVAYTGSNLPLPLWGPRFENTVRYVPIHGGLFAAPHHYLHVAPPSAAETPSEPAPERRRPERAAWLANLGTFGADWLFVARMYSGVARANRHDSEDFPVERAWADALPGLFTLRYASVGVRIYQVHPRRGPEAVAP